MTDYTKQCWSCGSTNLIQINNFFACNTCGATYNELPQPVPSIIELQHNETRVRPPGLRKRTYSPTRSACRRVAKARDAKGGIS